MCDFSPADIHNPKPDRFLLVLSALINFLRFREEVLARHEELSMETVCGRVSCDFYWVWVF